MVVTAKQFQSVLDVVKKWHDQGFRDRLVNGQLALVNTEDYSPNYTSKACALNYEAVFEQQSRGMSHLHHIIGLLCQRVSTSQ